MRRGRSRSLKLLTQPPWLFNWLGYLNLGRILVWYGAVSAYDVRKWCRWRDAALDGGATPPEPVDDDVSDTKRILAPAAEHSAGDFHPGHE